MKRKTTLLVRRATRQDIPDMLLVEEEAWVGKLQFTDGHLLSQMTVFPEGVICAINEGKIEGFVIVEMIDYECNGRCPSWYEVTDNGYIKNTHNPDGDTLYGVDLSVAPHAGFGVSSALMEAVGKLAIAKNVKQIVLGGRMPRYHKYKDKYTPEEYMVAKQGKRYLDPEIHIYHKAGLEVLKVMPGYFEDPESLNYGVLLRWKNPFYNYPRFIRWLIAKIFRI